MGQLMRKPLYSNLMDKLKSRKYSSVISAIEEGIDRGDTVADLELIGLDTRIANLLEQSDLEIITVEQLMEANVDDILKIRHFGNVQLNRLFNALLNYKKLKDLMIEQEANFIQMLNNYKLSVA